ncbi:MAG: hypothetical protein IPL67_08805 [Ignavibacteria bacterium]|nr:hypothetical protein [Ignavibacteria bacterium]
MKLSQVKIVTDLGAKNIGIADNASEFFNKYAIKSKKGRKKKDDNSSDAKGEIHPMQLKNQS